LLFKETLIFLPYWSKEWPESDCGSYYHNESVCLPPLVTLFSCIQPSPFFVSHLAGNTIGTNFQIIRITIRQLKGRQYSI